MSRADETRDPDDRVPSTRVRSSEPTARLTLRSRISPSPSRRNASARPYRTRSAAAKASQSPASASLAETRDALSEATDADGEAFEPSRRQAAFAGLAAAVAANITLPVGPALAGDPNKVVTVPYTKYEVTSESSAESLEAAKALKAAGARLYGAFWCENCNKQKEVLGKEAMQ